MNGKPQLLLPALDDAKTAIQIASGCLSRILAVASSKQKGAASTS
jgi:hypothetical protein